MLFRYEALDQNGQNLSGTVDAVSMDVAIASVQRRGLTISSIQPEGQKLTLSSNITLFEGVSNRDVVILSRQISTLFEAQVSALRTFRLLAEQSERSLIRRALTEVSDDLQAGNSISKALARHPKVFSEFYVNMVRAGEESGKLDQTFQFLADYLDRSYELLSKARNALIYPAFVMATFVAVMVLMLTLVIPRISSILIESGQEIPIYTKIVMTLSSILTDYGIFFIALLVIGGFFLVRYGRTKTGGETFSRLKLTVPYVGGLYQKLYLSRIADNMQAMLSSGIPAVRALEITGNIVGNKIFENILADAVQSVKTGNPISATFARYPEIPSIMVQMLQVGEETGEMGSILEKLARFYRREVNNAVDTLVNLIEPVLIVALAIGVGVLLASVLIPIYDISGAL